MHPPRCSNTPCIFDSFFQSLVRQTNEHQDIKERASSDSKKKSAIIYVSTSAMWEDKFIDNLMIILDHSALLSSTSAQHTLVSSRARLRSHLSGRESRVLVDIKKSVPRSAYTMSGRVCKAPNYTQHWEKMGSSQWSGGLYVEWVESKHILNISLTPNAIFNTLTTNLGQSIAEKIKKIFFKFMKKLNKYI